MNRLEGLLGRALDANLAGRLKHFVTGPSSPAIALFDPARAAINREGDWYGEHAGKWLAAAARGAARSGDAALGATVRQVADHLVSLQQPDGYLGTYAAERRFTHPQPPPQRTWDGAPSLRTWDVWVHSYLILGLLEAYRYAREPRYLEAARRIGTLCWQAFGERGIDVTHLGNHQGMSATVLLDPAVELYFATGEKRFLDLARVIVAQADARPELNLLGRALAGADAAEIGSGKAYQLAWNMAGLAKLHRAGGEPQYLEAARRVWESIAAHHLTLGGGPWGGVAHRSREVFNAPGAFSPYAYVETCSTFAWMQLSRELLAITGEARYAEEIERSAYNDLLGAQDPDGEEWIYYSFPNGQRVYTTYWRCCKSSGALALEELPALACTLSGADEISVNLYGPGTATLATASAGMVELRQATRYPFEGEVDIRVAPSHAARFAIRLRIPAWAHGARVEVAGQPLAVTPGTFAVVERTWQPGDSIALTFPMQPVLHRKSLANVQESVAPDGAPVRQQVLRLDYVALTRGPLAYATDLIDGFKREETLRVGSAPRLEMAQGTGGYEGPAIRLHAEGRAPLTFHPYYEAGGRRDGSWRLTWMQAAAEGAP